MSGPDAGTANQQRNPDDRFVDLVAVAEVHLVLHEGLAVVRGEEHQRLVQGLELRPGVHQPPDLVIHEGDLGVVGVANLACEAAAVPVVRKVWIVEVHPGEEGWAITGSRRRISGRRIRMQPGQRRIGDFVSHAVRRSLRVVVERSGGTLGFG
jgi:hypothetical protein